MKNVVRKLVLILLLLAFSSLAVILWNRAGFSQALPTLQVTVTYAQPFLATANAFLKGSPTPRLIQPLPLPSPDPQTQPGTACFASLDRGIACIDRDGNWQNFDQKSRTLPTDQIRDLAICPDGTLIAITSLGVSFFDGKSWSSADPPNPLNLSAAACDETGSWWIAHTRGISRFDGLNWQEYPSTLFLPPGDAPPILDLAAAPAGIIWLVMSDRIVRFQDEQWQGFSAADLCASAIEAVYTAPDGTPWVLCHDGILRFDGITWQRLTPPGFPYPRALAFSRQRVFAATARGLWVYDGGDWQAFTRQNSRLRRDDLYAIAIDESGRLWLGTDWGVDIFEADSIVTYFMHNAGLQDDQVRGLAITGAGPRRLPAPQEEPPAALRGRVLLADGRPLAKARLELCAGTARLRYNDTPCEDQPFRQAARTNADGSFIFENLPEGLYLLTVETRPGEWSLLRTPLGAPDRVLVRAGQENDLSDLLLP